MGNVSLDTFASAKKSTFNRFEKAEKQKKETSMQMSRYKKAMKAEGYSEEEMGRKGDGKRKRVKSDPWAGEASGEGGEGTIDLERAKKSKNENDDDIFTDDKDNSDKPFTKKEKNDKRRAEGFFDKEFQKGKKKGDVTPYNSSKPDRFKKAKEQARALLDEKVSQQAEKDAEIQNKAQRAVEKVKEGKRMNRRTKNGQVVMKNVIGNLLDKIRKNVAEEK